MKPTVKPVSQERETGFTIWFHVLYNYISDFRVNLKPFGNQGVKEHKSSMTFFGQRRRFDVLLSGHRSIDNYDLVTS